MIEQLFGSKTRVKLLQLFYQNPNRSFYVREITRKIDEQINSVRRELANLLNAGIIRSDNNNNRLYYEVNQSFEHYAALSSIFGNNKFKSSKSQKRVPSEDAEIVEEVEAKGHKDPFVNSLLKTGNVNALLYTGQFTRDEKAGVDIVLIGDVNQVSVDHLIADFEKEEKKSVRYSVLTPSEYLYRKQVNDKFISNIISSKKNNFCK